MKYKIGDRVRVRDWDDLAQEFGVTGYGDIMSPVVFMKSMRVLCGREFTVIGHHRYGDQYLLLDNCDFIVDESVVLPLEDEEFEETTDLKEFLEDWG